MVRSPVLNLHAREPRSRANGPGIRMVLWVQGCTLNCPGCFNPETHAETPTDIIEVERLAGEIKAEQTKIDGLTISGGEPFQQAEGLAALLSLVRRDTDLTVVVFSGYTLQELQCVPIAKRALGLIDVLIAGRYAQGRRTAGKLLGSANQRIHFLTDRYTIEDFQEIPETEIIIKPDGTIVISGIHPPKLKAFKQAWIR